MRKIIIILLLLATKAQSQVVVSLSVKLNQIQSLTINQEQKQVELVYQSRADYAQGVTSKQVDHLSVFSTGGFEIKVKANSTNLQNGRKSIPVSDITITPYNGSLPINNPTYSPVNLSTSESLFVKSDRGCVDKTISVDYSAKGGFEYIDLYQHYENANRFECLVVYTINPS